MGNTVKRIVNKLWGSGSFDPSMTEAENEIRVRQGYNSGFGG